MPRVLYILNRASIGGPVVVVALQAHYLTPQFDTLLISGLPSDNEKGADDFLEELSLKPIYIPEMGRNPNLWNDFKSYLKIRKIIKRFKPDIVHTQAAKPGTIGRLAAFHEGVPIILHTFHGHVFHSYFSNIKANFFIRIEKYLAKKSTAIIAISPLQKQELADVYKIAPEQKIEILPIGLNLSAFQKDTLQKRNLFRQELQLNEDIVLISAIGRVVPIKNLLFLINCLCKIKKSHIKWKALIVGDGDCRLALQSQASEQGLIVSYPEAKNYSADVIFTSWRRDIDIVNAGTDIAVLTSFNEGTPLSLIEAGASGKPSVVVNCGGVRDVIVNNVTGLVSEQGNESAFVENLLLLLHDKEKRQRLGSNAFLYISKKYGHEQLVQNTTMLYTKLLAKKKQCVPTIYPAKL